jgi:hypothetical protein
VTGPSRRRPSDARRGAGAPTDEDARFVLVDGRRWRATDPSIPDGFRRELVGELMSARRAVGAVTRAGGDPHAQRQRVQDAKVALGERGEPWWQAATDGGRRRRIEATIRALLRARGPESSICPSDVARVVGAGSWRPLLDAVRSVAADLVAAGTIVVTQRAEEVDVTAVRGPVRFRQSAAMRAGGVEVAGDPAGAAVSPRPT